MHPIHCPRLSDPGHTSLVMKDRKNQGGKAGRNLWEMDIFPARDFSSFPSESIKESYQTPLPLESTGDRGLQTLFHNGF